MKNKAVALHDVIEGYKNISKKLGEKVTLVDAIIRKWKSGAQCKLLLYGVKTIMTKVVDRPKTTREESVNDLKAVGITVSKNTISIIHYTVMD